MEFHFMPNQITILVIRRSFPAMAVIESGIPLFYKAVQRTPG
jgi:hypothetical protein